MPNVMAALPNISVALSAQCRKVWLTPSTRVPCSNARLGRKVNFALGEIPLGKDGKLPKMYI